MWAFSQEPLPRQQQASLRAANANSLSLAHPPVRLQSSPTLLRAARPSPRIIDKNSGPAPEANGNSGSHPGFDLSRIRLHATPPAIQKKLTVNTPGDSYEQEADRVSQFVMQMPGPQLQRSCACGGTCSDCQKKSAAAHLQMSALRPASPAHAEAPPIVHDVLRSSGQPLDSATRSFMEPRFGWDFSRVRIHSDAAAQQSAHAVNARAYTVGQNVVLGAGSHSTYDGRRLLAHELTHVVQQSRSAGSAPPSLHRSGPDPASPGSAGALLTPAQAPPQNSPSSKKGKSASFDIHPDAMEWLKDTMRQFYGQLSDKQRINLKRNSTVAIGVATIDGEPRLVYTVAGNRTSKEIRAAAEKLHLNRLEYDTDVKGRGEVGAPNDAEQLMKEFSVDHDIDLHGVVASRSVCKDCAQSYMDFKGRRVPVVAVEDTIEVPKLPPKAPTKAEKTEAAKPEKAEPQKAKPTAVEPQTAKPEPAKTKPTQTKPATPEPATPEPAKAKSTLEPATQPIKPQPAKTQPPKTAAPEPARRAPVPPQPKTAVDVESPAAAPRSRATPSPQEPDAAHAPSPKKSVPEIDLSAYPPDREGPITGLFKDAAVIHGAVALVQGAVTIISLATEKDISALGLVGWHFHREIASADAEFRSSYPEASALRESVSLDDYAKAYDAALGQLTLPEKELAAVALLAALSGDKDRAEAIIKTALQNFANSGGGQGRLRSFVNAAESYLHAASILEEKISNLNRYQLSPMAADIDRRASALEAAGDQLEQIFYKMLENPLVGWEPLEFAALEIQHLAGFFHDLALRLRNLALLISERAQDYDRLWDHLEAAQNRVYQDEKMASLRFNRKVPF